MLRTLDTSGSNRFLVSTCDLFDSPQFDAGPDEAAAVHQQTKAQSSLSRSLAEWSRRSLRPVQMSPTTGVVIVSYILPVVLSKSKQGLWSAVWDNENILALSLNLRVTWVGSVRFANAPVPPEEEEAVSRALLALNCFPVFINQNMNHQFYDVYCKQYLWPMMHQVADVYGPLNLSDIGAKNQQDLWFNYSTVSRLFRDKVLEVYQQGDLVWVHGFHLMLLPSFLRRTLLNAKIGIFLHTPFPSSEIWRTMARREDLLRGILSADHIGFHLYEYARHFRSVCHRLLGYNSDMSATGVLTVYVDGREVSITCMHVGIDLPRVQNSFTDELFERDLAKWRQMFAGRTVIAGLDRLERLKGIPLKLSAIDKFMEQNPRQLGKLVFALIGVTATERGEDYLQTRREVLLRVAQLNEKYSTTDGGAPLVYFEERVERDIRMPQRLAFFASSEVLMSTATRDGLNRFPMEFTVAKQKVHQGSASGQPNYGVVVMSEFVSSARVMRGALHVNPWKIAEVTGALAVALEMSFDERADRYRRNLEFSTKLTTNNWASQVLLDIMRVEKATGEGQQNFAVGFGMGFRVMGVKAGFHELDMTALTKAYKSSKCRLILLDWGGTLVTETTKTDKLQAYAVATGHASHTAPTEEIKSLLETLCADPRNVVFVVSGREQMAVSDFFGDVPGLGLGAEHGFFYRWPQDDNVEVLAPSSSGTRARWQTINSTFDQSWKEPARVVMEIYVQHTQGTYIEQKPGALIWQFRDADPEFGFMQSKELEEHLKVVLASHQVDVIRGGGVADGYIEVRPAGVSKGLFLQHVVATLKAQNRSVDFVLAVGDDVSDEPMFEQIERMSADSSISASCFGVTVGKKPTSAGSYIDDPKEVTEMMTTLIKTSQRENRYFSSVDLPSMSKPGPPAALLMVSHCSLDTAISRSILINLVLIDFTEIQLSPSPLRGRP